MLLCASGELTNFNLKLSPMVAIIPVAGAGTKLRPHTYTQPKSLIPIAGKTILGYIIEQLQDAGVDEFVFVIGYLGDKIRDYVDKTYPDITKSYVVQQMRDGLGHAIWLTKDLIAPDREAVIILGDTIMDIDMKKLLLSPEPALGVKKVDDPRIFGVAEIGKDNIITKLIEKPVIPKSNMALVGLYKIMHFGQLAEALDHNIRNNIKTNNEFYLTDGLQRMIDQGVKFRAIKIDNWYDCGQKQVLLDTNALLLKRMTQDVHQRSGLKNTIVVEPVYFGEHASVENCIIGPNVTIGDHAQVRHTIIRNSIVGNYTRLNDVLMYNSIVGSDSTIHGSSQSLSIGDNTELDLR
jgi:glucose-1-phosphate thymidylyltransferase